MKNFLLSFLVFTTFASFSQNVLTEKNLNISFSGFLKNDLLFDTRKNVEAVDGLYTLWPSAPSYDANGNDINAKASVRMLNITTRFATRVSGVQIGKAKIVGYIEVDFSGGSETNSLRFRHGYTSINWPKTQIIFGRTWHPTYVEKVYPSVLNLNTGVPFQVFNRSPQLRVTHNLSDHWDVIAAAVYQTKYVSMGPDGKSASYQRNALVPNLHLQFQYYDENWVVGAGFDWKMIQPRETTTGSDENIYVTSEKLASSAALAYVKYTNGKFQFKAKSMFGQNVTESLLPGGYAVATLNSETGAETYTPTNHCFNFVNFTYGAKWKVGLFAGYMKNFGTSENPIGPFYARGADVDYAYRIAPQLVYKYKNFMLGFEEEITTAAYGTIDYNDKGKVKDAEGVSNFRSLVTLFYFF